MYKRFFGIFVIGIVIKLMDDSLDQELDKLKGTKNLAVNIGQVIMPYSLILMIIALSLNYKESVGFFCASYILGMTYDFKKKLPTYLKGWQESILVLVISIFMTSVYNIISALVLILLLQLIDDAIDYKKDKYVTEINYLKKLGVVPGIFLILILLLISFQYYPLKLLYFFLAVILIYMIDYFFLDGGINNDN